MVSQRAPGSAEAREILVEIAVGTREAQSLREAQALVTEDWKANPDMDQLQIEKARSSARWGRTARPSGALGFVVPPEEAECYALLAMARFTRLQAEHAKVDELIDRAIKLAPDSDRSWRPGSDGWPSRRSSIRSLRSCPRIGKAGCGSSRYEDGCFHPLDLDFPPHLVEAMALLERAVAIARPLWILSTTWRCWLIRW